MSCREEVTKRLRAGEAQSDVALACGVSKQRVQQIARQIGVSGRREWAALKERRAQIRESQEAKRKTAADKEFLLWNRTLQGAVLRAQGMCWRAIAERLECDAANVCMAVLHKFPHLRVGRGRYVR